MELTKRIDLNLGYTCDLACRFCYYRESRRSPRPKRRRDLTTTEAKKWLRFFRRRGLEAVDLTGGEPTIRGDILELVNYARELGFRTVCVITNGIRMAEDAFCRRLAESGLNDVLFSLHGPGPEIHDRLTGTEGSFAKTSRALENAAGLGFRLRSNTVVTGVNLQCLEETADLLHRRGVSRANFILFNPVVEARNAGGEIAVRYREAAGPLRRLIEKQEAGFERLTIRYFPLCLLAGLEDRIVNMPRVQCDPDEWDYLWRSYFRRSLPVWLAAVAGGFFLHPRPRRLLRLNPGTALRESVIWSIIAVNFLRGAPCRRCRLYPDCGGVWRGYAERFGTEELRPA
ncbi:MAG: radical SAM protein [Candidatus Erginobacter occultus]|nr:radical SAM protein [Candidatus Erginobacter occultus]